MLQQYRSNISPAQHVILMELGFAEGPDEGTYRVPSGSLLRGIGEQYMCQSSVVYLYGDGKGVLRYAGRGTSDRAQSHVSGTHNTRLAKLIASGRYTLEAIDCGTRDAAVAVEAALIDLLGRTGLQVGLYNDAPGPTARRFVPLGVPERFAGRLMQQPGNPDSLARESGGILFVRISDGKLNDPNRGTINPLNPKPADVIDRIRHEWLLGALGRHWEAHPEHSPSVAAGVAGPPNRRYIIGALQVDRTGWTRRTMNGAWSDIPLANPSDTELDAGGLRGRRVELAFTQRSQDHAVFYDATGQKHPYQP